MCGIAGFSGDFEPVLLERMNGAQAHRGPDDAGVLFLPEARVGLAHRRLSIIDLSPRGRNPMWDVTRRVVIIYNGELYNYRELRRELVADGYAFHSDTDTEVLLNLYLRDGEKMLERLNGIFAFAIWDTRKRLPAGGARRRGREAALLRRDAARLPVRERAQGAAPGALDRPHARPRGRAPPRAVPVVPVAASPCCARCASSSRAWRWS